MTSAERVGLGGAVLLAGAFVAFAILFVGRRDLPEGGPEPEPEVATSTADDGARREEPEPEFEAGGARTADFRREILRLRQEVERRDEVIARQRARLEAAGVAVEEKPEEPVKLAGDLIERLKRCGVETSPTEIESLVGQIAAQNEGAILSIKRYLALGLDVTYTDTWSSYGGRFTAVPTLRLALLDALRRIAGGEGAQRIDAQAAMVTLLRNNERPLEIALLIGYLAEVRGVASVDEEVLAAAKRFLALEPHPREASLLPSLISVLSGQAPDVAAADLLAFYANPGRELGRAASVLDRIARLPEEHALPTLEKAAGLSEDLPRAARAAARLARMTGAAPRASLARILAVAGPPVRSAVFRGLPRPLGEEIATLERIALRAGIEGIDRLDRFDEERSARRKILDAAAAAEKDPETIKSIDAARKRLVEYETRAAKLRKRLRGG